MFLPKKHIPRRTFLRGAGVAVALPLLDAMVPALQPLRLPSIDLAPPEVSVGPGSVSARWSF